MRTPHAEWTEWANILHQLRLKGLVAWFLEAGEPLMLLGAQALYFGQPFLGRDRVGSLAHLLEDGDEARAFAAFLREDATS